MESEKPDSNSDNQPAKRPRWRRAAVATSVLGGMLLSVVVVLPMAVMNTRYRDQILNDHLQKHGLSITSGSAKGGWLEPISLHEVVVADTAGQVTCRIDELRCSHSVLNFLLDNRDLGTFTVRKPELYLTLDEQGKLPPQLLNPTDSAKDQSSRPDVAVRLEDATFVLSVPWRPVPIVELSGLQADVAVRTTDEGQWLSVEPIVVFDHTPISESHTEQNLALIAPVLSQSTSLAGEVSVALDGMRVRLDDDSKREFSATGKAVFHTVEAKLKQEWASQISALLGRVAGMDVPNHLEIVKNSQVDFRVNEDGIHHKGLAFLLPGITQNMSIHSSGLVGLDERLDLALGLQLPQFNPSNAFMAVLSKMTRLPLQLQVKGTVDKPELQTPPGFAVVDQLSGNLSSSPPLAEPPAISKSVIDLIGAAASTDKEVAADGLVGGVLNIIRAAKKARDESDRQPREPKPRKVRKKRQQI